MNMKQNLTHPIFRILADVVAAENLEAYVIGGFVRDTLINRTTNDIDIVVIGNGIDLAEKVAKQIGPQTNVTVFKNFGTEFISGLTNLLPVK